MNNLRIQYNRFTRISAAVMAIVYFCTGGLFLFVPDFLVNFMGSNRCILGSILLFYGIYRVYRSFVLHKPDENEN